MTISSATPGGSGDPYARLVASLQMGFESSEACALAARILEGEKAEFHWDARVQNTISGSICWQILAMMRVAKSALGSRY